MRVIGGLYLVSAPGSLFCVLSNNVEDMERGSLFCVLTNNVEAVALDWIRMMEVI